MLNLRLLDLTALVRLNEKAVIRIMRRSKNLKEIRVSCIMNVGQTFFYCLREMKKVDSFSLNSPKILNSGDLKIAEDLSYEFAKHISFYKLKALSVYSLNNTITTSYSKNAEQANLLESLSFATVKDNDFDLLQDLCFFPNLKKLAICYNLRDAETEVGIETIEEFNNHTLSEILIDICVELDTIVIGGLLNNEGAKILADSMKKYQKIKNIRLLNCLIYEDGLYKILEQGKQLERLDITGCLLCCTGEAFNLVNKNYNPSSGFKLPLTSSENSIYGSGILQNMKEIKMSVISHERLSIKTLLLKIFGPEIKLTFDCVKLKH
mmetsp:Transcript_15881/g.13880  ORF Transcript_15881/g.13880 Transcript_15881/m.13880 type:complete len:322 (+) Transcript_15881:254-1219(+)